MIDAHEITATPYAPPAVSSHAEKIPVGMVAVVQDRELARFLTIRRRSPLSCLICIGTVAIWTSFVSTLFGGIMLYIPPPPDLAVSLLSATAVLAAGALTAIAFTVLAALRPKCRFAVSAYGLFILSAGFAIAITVWMFAVVPYDADWNVSVGMALWTFPIWFSLPHGLLSVRINRYVTRRLKEAGLSDRAIALNSGRIYDYPR